MANTGLGSQLGIKKETTWGTAVVVDKFFKYESESFALAQNYVDPIGLQAGITFAPQSLTKATTRTAGGDFTAYAPFRQTGLLFDQMVAGTITPVQQSSTIAYLSTFNVGQSVPTKSATIQINKPTLTTGDVAYTYPGCVLTAMGLSMATGGVLMSTWSWLAKDETTPATTPAGSALATASYAANDDVWAHQSTVLNYAGGGSAPGITSVDLTWNQPYADDLFYLDGSGTRGKPVPNGIATVTGNLNGRFYDSTFYAAFRSGAFASLTLTFAGPTAIATTFFPTIKITLPAIQVRGSSPTVDNADLLDQSIPFVAKYDGTNAPMKIEYTSVETAAW
jgi:hypothetical protein